MDDNKKKQETASATSYLDSEAGLFYSTLSKEDFDD